MTAIQSLYQTFNRYRTLQTHRISSLPIVILMPHSACNCRCVMCDIWKGNHNLKQLTEADISALLSSLVKFGTQQVLMSGGEALLNPNFFRLCKLIKKEKIKISLLSTGLAIQKNAEQIVQWVDDIIVSLDGDEGVHDAIRNIPGAFRKMKQGISELRQLNPLFKVSGRTVIHRLNYRIWPAIIDSAKALELNSISFLPADVSSMAFNREMTWDEKRQQEILIPENELENFGRITDEVISSYYTDIKSGFIVESPQKLEKIYLYYAAFFGKNPFPYKKCNAPWVSAVIEADGNIRPCFFHKSYGNTRDAPMETVINSPSAIAFRKQLDMDKNATCIKCVCYLNIRPGKQF